MFISQNYPFYQTYNQIPQENQRERVITNPNGDTRNKHYYNIFQAWLRWDKNMLDKVKVNYSHVTIVQEYDLKGKLEEIGIKRDEVIIAPINDINMYPYIKLTTIKKAVRLLSKRITAATRKKNNLCL